MSELRKNELARGKEKHLKFALYSQKFFGGSDLIGQAEIETLFTRSNTIEEKVQVGPALISYVVKVKMSYRPIVTDLVHYTLTKVPAYKHSLFIEGELIKKYMIYSNPSPSEIH